jgi:hypothetical protein
MQVTREDFKRKVEAATERIEDAGAGALSAGEAGVGGVAGGAAAGLTAIGGALAAAAGVAATAARVAARMSGRQAKRTYRLRRAVRPVALVVGWLLVYRRWGRGWVRGWGAAGPEEQAVLPGDGIVPSPKRLSTRGVTIQAPPSAVWPWLAQLGQGRGGLYSYDWLENLFGCGIHSADRILPEHQQIAVGDRVRLVRPGYPVDLCFEVAEVRPEEALVLRSPGEPAYIGESSLPWASWAFVLHPLTGGRTRLLVRWRSDFADAPASRFWNDWGIELPHFMMERKMMLGMKQRAEDGGSSGV